MDPADSFITIFGGKITDCLNIGEEVCEAAIELGIRLDKDRKDWYGEPPKATRDEFFRQARPWDSTSCASGRTSRRSPLACGGGTGCAHLRCLRPSATTLHVGRNHRGCRVRSRRTLLCGKDRDDHKSLTTSCDAARRSRSSWAAEFSKTPTDFARHANCSSAKTPTDASSSTSPPTPRAGGGRPNAAA